MSLYANNNGTPQLISGTGNIAAVEAMIPNGTTPSVPLVNESTIKRYTPTAQFASMDDFLADIKSQGAGHYVGNFYQGLWYTYDITIISGSSGYWYGMGEATNENGVSYTFSKMYSDSNTWTIARQADKETVPQLQKYWIWNGQRSYTITLPQDGEKTFQSRRAGLLAVLSTGSDNSPGFSHLFLINRVESVWGVYDVGGSSGFSASMSGNILTINTPEGYNTATLYYPSFI